MSIIRSVIEAFQQGVEKFKVKYVMSKKLDDIKRKRVYEAILADLKAAYDNGGEFFFTIQSGHEARSAAQLRLKWMWMGEIMKQMIGTGHGLSKEGWNRFFKDRYLKGLLLAQNEAYADFYRQLDEVRYQNPDSKFIQNRMLDLVQTEWLDVKHMAAFLNEVSNLATMEMGVNLTFPDDLMWLQEEGHIPMRKVA